MRIWTLALGLTLSACSDKDDGGGDGTADGGTADGGGADGGATDGGGTDGGGTTPTDADPWSSVDETLCEAVPGFEGVAGASSYFVGDYTPGDSPTSGTETWALYANSAWEAEGGADCIVVWNMTASTTDAGACDACDYGLSVSATLDTAATTCPEDLYVGEESWTAAYSVEPTDDGKATWYYYDSGTEFAVGFVGTHLQFVTEGTCVWF